MFDLDFFKRVNDAHGHAAGDIVLGAIGEWVRSNKRQSDLFGRIGGDEFVLLLPMTSKVGATLVAERLISLVRVRPIYCSGTSVTITVSVGIATSEQDGQSYGKLFERADKALYEAKRTGRNRFVAD